VPSFRDDTAAIACKLSEICSRSGVEKNCFLNYHAKAVLPGLHRGQFKRL